MKQYNEKQKNPEHCRRIFQNISTQWEFHENIKYKDRYFLLYLVDYSFIKNNIFNFFIKYNFNINHLNYINVTQINSFHQNSKINLK